jgi:hypothetical protein
VLCFHRWDNSILAAGLLASSWLWCWHSETRWRGSAASLANSFSLSFSLSLPLAQRGMHRLNSTQLGSSCWADRCDHQKQAKIKDRCLLFSSSLYSLSPSSSPSSSSTNLISTAPVTASSSSSSSSSSLLLIHLRRLAFFSYSHCWRLLLNEIWIQLNPLTKLRQPLQSWSWSWSS